MFRVKHILPDSIQHAGDSSPGPAEGQHIVATKNRWSRVVLKFQGVTPDVWSEFSFQISCHPAEEAQNVHDFASVGIDFLTEDGSSIDFAYVPGLARSQIDPYNDFIAGPAYYSQNTDPAAVRQVRCNFLIPAPTQRLAVNVRGWRNSHPFQISNPVLRQFVQPGSLGFAGTETDFSPSQTEHDATSQVRRNWKTLSSEPRWLSYNVIPSRRLFVRGQVIAKQTDKDGAMVRVVFRNVHGEELPPPYPEILMGPAIGAFISIPTHMQARRFTLELEAPPQAATVDLGFQAWRDGSMIDLVVPLEVSLENGLLLENISSEETPAASSFIIQLSQKLDLLPPAIEEGQAGLFDLLDEAALASRLKIHPRLRGVQRSESNQKALNQLRLDTFDSWTLPDAPSWNEDPFHSHAWRLEYHSLSWLLGIVKDVGPNGFSKALQLALSWSRGNRGEQPTDMLSAHPAAMAVRAEVLLEMLAIAAAPEHKTAPEKLLELTEEVIRHCFSLSEIISQNIFSYSIFQIHAASSLLALARALPRIPLSNYWSSLALSRLREGFDELIGPDGVLFEQSQHHRLELISLGLILSAALENVPEAYAFRQDLAPRLKKAALTVIALTDPAGMLPPFGDAPPGHHHASWLRRLISQYGQVWLRDNGIRTELTYPQGSRVLVFSHAGAIAARHYEHGQEWSYLYASFSEQRQLHDHYDCTSFVYSAGGVRWITDPGGSSVCETGAARQYLVSSRAHNVALPDGREQTAGTGWLQSTTSFNGADIFEICSNVHGPDYVHRRYFISLKDLGAVAVFDHFTTSERPFAVEGFLHFEPEVMAAIANPQLVIGFRGQKRLRIIPRIVTGRLSGLEIVQGLNAHPSSIQGFVSRRAGILEPANVLRYKLSGQRNICGGVIMAMDETSLKAIVQIIDAPDVNEFLAQPTAD